jgi:hypothetical protein
MNQVADRVLYSRRQKPAEVNGYGICKEVTAVRYMSRLRNALEHEAEVSEDQRSYGRTGFGVGTNQQDPKLVVDGDDSAQNPY